MNRFNDLDGSIEHFDAVSSSSNVSVDYHDQDNFYPMNGSNELDGSIEHFDAVFAGNNTMKDYHDQDNFYPANGLFKGNKKKGKKGGFFNKLLANQKEKNRLKYAAKEKEAAAQKEAAKSLGKGDDSALLASLTNNPTPSVESSKGLSMGAKIGIGVGVAAVLGIGAYFLLKKKK